jgi:RNA polymerase sigma-70 factor, ECF subfamily
MRHTSFPETGAPRSTHASTSVELQAHRDRLLRSACALCGSEADAQDLVQDTLLQALLSARQYRGDSAVHTWLHGILLNLCHRHFQRQQRKRCVFEDGFVLVGRAEPNSMRAIDQAFCAHKLAAALQRLSGEHRAVIVLRYYEGLKVHEIAERTGVPSGTVKSRLHYAIHRLEQFIPSNLRLFLSRRRAR